MEWPKQKEEEELELELMEELMQKNIAEGGGGLSVIKVMTDDQLELLRRQISVYATICEQLVQMHKAFTAQHDLPGMSLGNLYCDPIMASVGHKITARQRWAPTQVQLQILEHIFDEGNGTPSKQKIKEITLELTQHGQISETNVYNWFQNRRARSKRKQSVTIPNNADSEFETEVGSPKDKKEKHGSIQIYENLEPCHDDVYSQGSEFDAELFFLDAQSNKGEAMFSIFQI